MGATPQLATAINETAARVQEVAEDNARIGAVLDVIKGIAEQTDLLGLNLTVAAVRAILRRPALQPGTTSSSALVIFLQPKDSTLKETLELL